MESKTCSGCKLELKANIDNFNAMKKGKYGLSSKCKPCLKKYRDVYRQKPDVKEKHRVRQQKYRHENPTKILEINRKRYDINGHKYNATKSERLKKEPEFREKILLRERKYKESGRRKEIRNQPEQMEKARLRSAKRRTKTELKEHDYKRNEIYRNENKHKLHKMHVDNRENLHKSYVAQSMRVKAKDLPEDIYQTKKLIIQLKRELKNN